MSADLTPACCGNCWYSDPFVGGVWLTKSEIYSCHRYAPVATSGQIAEWPVVPETGWCGEWKDEDESEDMDDLEEEE